jgi:hypothetical protein
MGHLLFGKIFETDEFHRRKKATTARYGVLLRQKQVAEHPPLRAGVAFTSGIVGGFSPESRKTLRLGKS